MRETVEATEAERAHQRVYTPQDLGFNGVTWAKGATPGVGGTLSLDILVWHLREFTLHAIGDNDWALDMQVWNENDVALTAFAQILTAPGVVSSGGTWAAVFVRVPVWANRVRFLGRGLFGVSSPNSSARVHARS